MATKKTGEDKPAKPVPDELLRPMPVKPGRPSDYRPEFCFHAIAAGAEGKSKAVIAAELGVSERTLYTWMQQHPEFLQAMEQSETLAQSWWEEAGRKAMFMPGFNASVWSRSMSARFPKTWRENKQSTVEHTGKDGAPIAMEITTTLNVDQMSQRALDALEEALEIFVEGQGEEEDDGPAN